MKQEKMELWVTQLQAAKNAFEAMIDLLVEEEGDWEAFLPLGEERTVFPKEEKRESQGAEEKGAVKGQQAAAQKDEDSKDLEKELIKPKEAASEESQKMQEAKEEEKREEHGKERSEEMQLLEMAKKRFGSQEGARILFFLEEKDLLRDENGKLMAVDFTGAKEAMTQFLAGQPRKVEGTGMQWGTRKQENDRFVAGARRGAKLRG